MEDRTLLTWLTQQYPLAKRTTFRRMLSDRRVRVNGKVVVKLNQPLQEADRVEVGDRVEAKSHKPAYIIFEDADLIVVNKQTGLLTSTGPRETRKTILELLRKYVAATDDRARLGLIHRLDRDASGLLVFSKSDVAYQSLKTQFFDNTLLREYASVINGRLNPPRGKIDSRLIERADGTVRSTDVHAKGQRAITDYETIRSENDMSLLKLRLFTGRKHQIRAHLSEKGTTIVGDTMYGAADTGERLMLAAIRLGFKHPRAPDSRSNSSCRCPLNFRCKLSRRRYDGVTLSGTRSMQYIYPVVSWIYLAIPVLALAVAYRSARRRRNWHPLHVVFRAWIMGLLLGAGVAFAYRSLGNFDLPISQLLRAAYTGASAMCVLYGLNLASMWLVTSRLLRLDRRDQKPPPVIVQIFAGCAQAILIIAIGTPYLGSVLLIYRPKAAGGGRSGNRFSTRVSKTVSFDATDGTHIAGVVRFQATQNRYTDHRGEDKKGHATVLLCHGFAADKSRDLYLVETLVANGYNILAIDLRAHGESGGQFTGFGGVEKSGCIGRNLRYLRREHAEASHRIVGLGEGLGRGCDH